MACDLKIDEVLLDSSNPRIGEAASQREALQKIISDQREKLAALAEDIIESGMSPIDRILVMREKDGQYVALEGNRRIAALKILSNPAVLASLTVPPRVQRRLEEAAKDFKRAEVEPLPCYEVPNREAARRWIHLRHTGENNGVGVVNWSGVAAARFRGTDPALQALEFVQKYADLTPAQRDLLGNAFPITTLDRLLSTKDVRQAIGIEVHGDKLRSGLPADELMKSLRRMVLDLAEKKVNVSQLKNREQQLAYVQQFAAADRPDLTKVGEVRDVDEITGTEFAGKTRRGKRGGMDPSTRRTLVLRAARLNISVPKVAEIFKEMRTIKIDECPHAAAVLLRVFLELSVDSYMDANKLPGFVVDKGGTKRDKSLHTKLDETIKHLVAHKGCNRKDFRSVERGLSDKHSPLHIELLNAYVHNRFVTPKPRELRTAWDDAQRFFESIWV